jgi:hypothetical protein
MNRTPEQFVKTFSTLKCSTCGKSIAISWHDTWEEAEQKAATMHDHHLHLCGMRPLNEEEIRARMISYRSANPTASLDQQMIAYNQILQTQTPI